MINARSYKSNHEKYGAMQIFLNTFLFFFVCFFNLQKNKDYFRILTTKSALTTYDCEEIMSLSCILQFPNGIAAKNVHASDKYFLHLYSNLLTHPQKNDSFQFNFSDHKANFVLKLTYEMFVKIYRSHPGNQGDSLAQSILRIIWHNFWNNVQAKSLT